jgi:hypothetical protein
MMMKLTWVENGKATDDASWGRSAWSGTTSDLRLKQLPPALSERQTPQPLESDRFDDVVVSTEPLMQAFCFDDSANRGASPHRALRGPSQCACMQVVKSTHARDLILAHRASQVAVGTARLAGCIQRERR